MKYDWYNELSEVFMGRGYFHDGASIQDRVQSISDVVRQQFGNEIGDKAKEYIELGYYVLPSPVWSNVGTGRGSGVSCFNTYIDDNIPSIIRGIAEVAMMCKIGGGTSGYMGNIRAAGSPISTGGESMGSVHFASWYAKTKETISQGATRRGEFAGYWPLTHADIESVLEFNIENSSLQRFPYGVTIPRGWLQSMKEDDMGKRNIWARVINARNNTGFPYLFFEDNVNDNTVDVFKDLGLEIKSSNMCTEILLPSSTEESFVCNLIGMNLVKYDEWKRTDAVRIAVYIADAVLTEFIRMYTGVSYLERAVNFASKYRAIAIGASGYHSYLQSRMIPFESIVAKGLNIEIFKTIQLQSYAASREMYEKYGASDTMMPYKRRHATLNGVAPNTSSSFIVGIKLEDIIGIQSQSIEPYVSNYYIKKAAKMKLSIKNPYLMQLLRSKDQDKLEVWESILKNSGSVQHLEFLTDDEKLVFRTFAEISQMEIIIQASHRQKYIDPGQSLNLMIHPATPNRDINQLILKAHELGIKTLYYQLGQNAAQEFGKNLLQCESCSG